MPSSTTHCVQPEVEPSDLAMERAHLDQTNVIFNISKIGGHLGSSLGVIELTVALHYVFNTPQEKILWDVGHQVWKGTITWGTVNSLFP
ncbi:hypothetical protein L2E82_06937 [Cichorium intybus]|uniref:Uncharacterized protein n=1 Tax=Cichorium intybus TaxID=13427 RepID=A0ACB9G3K5_CICIN|nr:hypothetical protein L2E82_06937 [Cichorium intybus]